MPTHESGLPVAPDQLAVAVSPAAYSSLSSENAAVFPESRRTLRVAVSLLWFRSSVKVVDGLGTVKLRDPIPLIPSVSEVTS